ncbi:hypothetical protein MSIBF_A3540003 [groundwater metagenome]|uniref:Lipoprotein n=1 Tax=groundwater metagenome TaxID=717931 RepID=A0A098ECL0_9ZZZZ
MEVNIKSLLNIVVCVIIIGIIIIGGCIEEKKVKVNENNNITEGEICPTCSVPSTFESKETKEELKINTKPQLNVGEEWTYTITMSGFKNNSEKISFDVIYNIEGIERINKTDCYVIQAKPHSPSLPELDSNKYIVYLSKDTGDLIKLSVESVIQEEGSKPIYFKNDIDKELAEPALYGGFLIGDFMLQPWMLALSKDLKWKDYSNSTSNEKDIKERFEYIVKDIESVDGRECFKVEMSAFNIEESRVTIKKILWVDINKRVLVKAKTTISNNLEVIAANLKGVSITK